MKTMLLIAAALAVTMLNGRASYSSDGYYLYEPWGAYDGGVRDHHPPRKGGGRSEPGNEAGMFPGRPGDGHGGVGSGGGDARGGEAGSR